MQLWTKTFDDDDISFLVKTTNDKRKC